MKLAKPHFDVGLLTNQLKPMLRFWQREVGLPYQELLPTGEDNHQHRHDMNGSVLKLNHARNPLPDAPPGGIRELKIARPELAERSELLDPDGNRVTLLPPGEDGIVGIGVRVAARDPSAQASFYRDALELEELGAQTFRCGDSLIFLEHDPEANSDVQISGPGFRYLTIQVFDCEREHARILEQGGSEGYPPRRAGSLAIFSMVRDPDGNWIEISQRASLTGAL